MDASVTDIRSRRPSRPSPSPRESRIDMMASFAELLGMEYGDVFALAARLRPPSPLDRVTLASVTAILDASR